jgi:SAM-dependent methyltransferase
VNYFSHFDQSLDRKFQMFRRYLNFGSRHASFDQRNRLMAKGLPKPHCWILDVGANIGQAANMLAGLGHYVVGVEKFAKEQQVACRNSEEGTAFMHASVTPDMIRSSPSWDAILLLSVLHRIYAFEGEAYMRAILNACGEKTSHLFIEGSTRHKRYMDGGHAAPAFADFDVDDAVRWHNELFRDELGVGWRIWPVTVLKHSKNEPHRLLFQAVKQSG